MLVNAAAAAAEQNQKPVNLRYGSIRSQLNRVRNALLPRSGRSKGIMYASVISCGQDNV